MLEGNKGGGRVGVGEAGDMGDGMQCSDHPCKNKYNPGGICAFCLQEKLGKLVSSSSSSSFPLPVRGTSSSSSSSPSFRSDTGVAVASCGGGNGSVIGISSTSSSSLSISVRPVSTKSGNDNGKNGHYQECYTRRARIPFLLAKKKIMVALSDHHHAAADEADIVLKRSKSTVTPRRGRFLDGSVDDGGSGEDFSPRIKRGGFWSFLYLSSKTHSAKKLDKTASMAAPTATSAAAAASGSAGKPKEKSLGSSMSRKGNIVVMKDDGDADDVPNNQATPSAAASSSYERKVSRSRSVGCGSRSFSGDFFERISTGLGDCTLRRVQSQREGKPKLAATQSPSSSSSAMKERVKCGGIFGGFIITSSSSSSYWLTSSADQDHYLNGKPTSSAGSLVHGRTKSWGWAFASPMRAFTKPSSSSSSGKKDTTIRESNDNNNNPTPNLSATPSLLAVRG